LELLSKEVEVFGLTYFGDGATVKKMPLINILASGVHLPVAVLEIHDCSKHMADGGKKDAKYIVGLFRPHLDEMELLHPNTSDVVFFDSASNVQKAGQVMWAHYPRLEVLHAAEHVISLFHVFSFIEFKSMYGIARQAYRIFGSGSRHAAYAIFRSIHDNTTMVRTLAS
jgi:hypothetical protein